MIPVCLEKQQIMTPININQVFLSFIPTDNSKIPRTKKASQIAPGDAKYNRILVREKSAFNSSVYIY